MSVKKYLKKLPSLEDKQILITGATSGIGLSLVNQLLMNGATNLVFLARNENKANKLIKELKNKYQKAKIELIIYDQSDFVSIDNAIEEIVNKYPNFYALVLNAGIMFPSKEDLSKQNRPLTMDTNFVGLAYFLKHLIPQLKTKHKYIFQGSLASRILINKNIDIFSNKLSLKTQYSISKSGVESLFYYYANLSDDNTYLLCEPGVTKSDLFRTASVFYRIGICVVSHSLAKSSLPLYKALLDDTNGHFYAPRGILNGKGYPKLRRFPKHRIRSFLLKQIKDII